jgi:hypothetical protein
MTELRILVLSDDFTPAPLFRDGIEAALSGLGARVLFHCVDTDPGELFVVYSEEVTEAFGDIAEVAFLAKDCHVIVTTFAPGWPRFRPLGVPRPSSARCPGPGDRSPRSRKCFALG